MSRVLLVLKYYNTVYTEISKDKIVLRVPFAFTAEVRCNLVVFAEKWNKYSQNTTAALSSCFTQQGIIVFMCITWFGFIKWRTTKDMMEGKNMIGYIMSTNVLMRETQDILSCGASTTASEHDCGRRTAVIYSSSQ